MEKFSDAEILDIESRLSFEFFWQQANTDKASPGYGLIRDRFPGLPHMASIASVGFGLTAIIIGAQRGWVSSDDARERAFGTLVMLYERAEEKHGFFYHFLDMQTAKRYGNCEVSVIDTAIAICGALTAGEYFGGDLKDLADRIYARVDWNWYRNPQTNQFYMGYIEERGGHFGKWDHYAEQFMMYFLGAASPTHPIDPEMFYQFDRYVGEYGGHGPIIHSTRGSLFVYQFSHAWFALKDRVDRDGVDWFANSVLATKANRQFCIDAMDQSKTFGENSWGLTACDGPRGYSGGYGADPNVCPNGQDFIDGTIAPCGAAGSMVFTPEESIAALRNFYENYPQLRGPYGLQDAFNLDENPAWFARDVIGIDKGITLLMIENYRSGLVWNVFMNSPFAQLGLVKCGFADKSTSATA